MKNKDEVVGIIELASFYSLEDYQKDFIEKIAETIATAILSIKINERTKLLLIQAQEQAEQLKSAEEEMRQNIEEIAATQEEMRRRELEYMEEIRQLKAKIRTLAM